jgi:hypothetical protein
MKHPEKYSYLKQALLFIFLLTTFMSCSGEKRNMLQLIKPTGRYPVGTIRTLLYDRRIDVFSKNGMPSRPIAVQVWYPSVNGLTARTPGYMRPEISGFMISGKKDADYRFPQEMGASWSGMIAVNSKLDSSPAYGKFPVLIFSPGLHSVCALVQNYIEDLASNGYVVVGVDSAYVCGAIVLSDGNTLYNEPYPADVDFFEYLAIIFPEVAKDMNFVLKELVRTDGSVIGGKFKGKLDFGKVGAFGVSFGGSGAMELAMKNPLVKAAADIDGSIWSNIVPYDKSVMFIESGVDDDRSMAIARANTSGRKYRIQIKTALHENFSDVPYILEFFYPDGSFKYPNTGRITPARCTEIVRTSLLAFFNDSLRYGKDYDLKTVLKEYDEVELYSE